MAYTLGLDLGSSSLGWALVDEDEKRIIKTGVRVFPGAASKLGTGKEVYKNQKRRLSRQARRQTFRRKQRRVVLLRTLVEYDMCPLTMEELRRYSNYKKGEKQEFPKSEELTAWLKLNPYYLRDKALTEPITRYELGRIFYHIIHHRGFKTGRKSDEDGALYKGNDETIGVSDTKDLLSRYKTLGSYLNAVRLKYNGKEKLRGRYTLRDWYVNEFNIIWERQSGHLGLDCETVTIYRRRYFGPVNSSEYRRKVAAYKKAGIEFQLEGDFIGRTEVYSLRDYLGDPEKGILFYQKPLKSQKHLLSKCRYEPNKTVCQISHPEFEYYRALQFTNQLEYGAGERLNSVERKQVVSFLCEKDKATKLSDVKKKLNKQGIQFNYPDDHKIPGCPTISFISKTLGVSDPKSIDWNLYHSLWNDLVFYDSYEKLRKKFLSQYKIDVSIEELKKYKVVTDYSSLSLKAIRNIVPYLERSLLYNDAVVFAGIRRVIGTERVIPDEEKIIDDVTKLKDPENREKNQSFTEALKEYLSRNYQKSSKQTDKLYHHSQTMSSVKKSFYLSELPNLRNPVVQQALQELKTVVNALVKNYLAEGEQFSKIKVELARELKLPRDVRRRMQWENSQREERNNTARNKIMECGLTPSRENIQKYLLYMEIQQNARGQSVQCPYTGQSLSLTDVLGTENKVQVEHIIPYSISLDDSMGNKTLCIAEENGRKGELTPYQFYKTDPDTWGQVKSRAFALLPYEKAKRFVSTKDYQVESFLQRQLNDTRYISKAARDYLFTICDQVYVFPGSLTAKVRRMWGLNSILSPPIQTPFNGRSGKYWAVMNDDGVFIELSEQEKAPPALREQDILVNGILKGGMFNIDSRFTAGKERSVPIEHNTYDTPGWMVYTIESVDECVPVFSSLPDTRENTVWLKGRAQVKDSSSAMLMLSSVPVKVSLPPGQYEDDALYWVNVPVAGKLREGSSGKDVGKNELRIKRVKVDQGKAEVWIDKRPYCFDYDSKKSQVDLIIPMDLQNILHCVPMFSTLPSVGESQLALKGKIDSNGRFTPDNNLGVALPVPGNEKPGVVYAIVNVKSRDDRFYPKLNQKPIKGKGKNVLAGYVFQEDGTLVFNPEKNRMDHRHHAVDALTIAFLNMSQLRNLSGYFSRLKKRQRNNTPRPSFPLPWETFRFEAQRSINQILVVHRQKKEIIKKVKKRTTLNGRTYISQGMSVRDQLHKDTVYGKRFVPGSDEPGYHVRKSVKDLTSISKIADAGTREILKELIESQGNVIDKKGKIKSEWLAKGDDYKAVMPSSESRGNPIKKVRIRENLGNAVQWHEGINQFVNPHNNYAIVVYKNTKGEFREYEVQFWDAIRAVLSGKSPYNLPEDGEIVTIMHMQDMFLLGLSDEQLLEPLSYETAAKHLYRVQNLSSMDFVFRFHTESTLDRKFYPYYIRIASFKSWIEKNPVKVKVSHLGELYYK